MLKRRLVCSLDELPPGTMKLVDVGKFGVGVYNV
jgi:nitrite reductase/ring-hydroxylating ferredoxin subunit